MWSCKGSLLTVTKGSYCKLLRGGLLLVGCERAASLSCMALNYLPRHPLPDLRDVLLQIYENSEYTVEGTPEVLQNLLE